MFFKFLWAEINFILMTGILNQFIINNRENTHGNLQLHLLLFHIPSLLYLIFFKGLAYLLSIRSVLLLFLSFFYYIIYSISLLLG